jgi:hypothetical protein
VQETIIEEVDEDEDLEDWEARGDMIYGEVRDYDVWEEKTSGGVFETGN